MCTLPHIQAARSEKNKKKKKHPTFSHSNEQQDTAWMTTTKTATSTYSPRTTFVIRAHAQVCGHVKTDPSNVVKNSLALEFYSVFVFYIFCVNHLCPSLNSALSVRPATARMFTYPVRHFQKYVRYCCSVRRAPFLPYTYKCV